MTRVGHGLAGVPSRNLFLNNSSNGAFVHLRLGHGAPGGKGRNKDGENDGVFHHNLQWWSVARSERVPLLSSVPWKRQLEEPSAILRPGGIKRGNGAYIPANAPSSRHGVHKLFNEAWP
jgi:hypothetical protein